ncbi:unnamed protein product [Ceutorhynchus assimilis]|uniref:Uncharacterized protein n=1 Tax=Ceutorhynchus assimilis TaxID=467358 RepID=A0A9N9MVY2_9CUCU|nr:unnamed protein product [Ceutorhynchus assimilis]
MKLSSTALKSAYSKRKSNTLVNSISKGSIRSVSESFSELSLPMPNILPEKQELWDIFSLSPSYQEKVERYKLNANEAEISFDNYQNVVLKLRHYHEDVRARKTDLILAKIMPTFMKKGEFDSEGNLLTTTEELCKERFIEAEEDFLQQKDVVQKEKRIYDRYFANQKNIVDEIEEEFDKFCNKNYKAPSPTPEFEDSGSISDVKLEEKPAKTTLEQEVRGKIPSIPSAKIVTDLQKLMNYERKKRQTLLAKKKAEWKNF